MGAPPPPEQPRNADDAEESPYGQCDLSSWPGRRQQILWPQSLRKGSSGDGDDLLLGRGGSKDTLEQCAGTLIGKNPFRIEAIWQEMYIAWFYPPGREKAHALGALDLALWDIKGKALGLPVHELLGGAARDYCECYVTSGVNPPAGQSGPRASLRERARRTMEEGYRAFRIAAADPPIGGVYDSRAIIRQVAQDCKETREGVGPDGNWCIDFHQRFELNEALRLCRA